MIIVYSMVFCQQRDQIATPMKIYQIFLLITRDSHIVMGVLNGSMNSWIAWITGRLFNDMLGKIAYPDIGEHFKRDSSIFRVTP